jgi:hypothetical protein
MFTGAQTTPRSSYRYAVFMLIVLSSAALLPLITPRPVLTDVWPLPARSFDRIQLPLSFEVNAGQTDESVAFLTRSLGGTLFFRADDVVLSLPTAAAQPQPFPERARQRAAASPPGTTVQLRFLDANPAARLVGLNPQPGAVNYLTGNQPSQWRKNIPTYAGLQYEQLYPGIDLHYEGTVGQLKGTYRLAPGADPARIRWRYDGAQATQVDPSTGELRITLAAPQPVTLIEQTPVAWQEVGGQRVPVDARYIIAADGSIHFALGAYNPTLSLIIDPTLTYASYLGGNGADYGYDIAVDAQGNFYVTGATSSTNFPLVNPVQATPSEFGDLFVTKFNAGGSSLAYSTYLGGNDSDVGFGIEVDGAGNAYVTGESWSRDFPVVNPIERFDPGIQQDVIAFKLNPAGNSLVYSTYLGGTNSQTGWDIALDTAGNVYLTGHTLSDNFPVVNPIQPQNKGGRDAFVTKINAAGSALVYSTYLGSNGNLDYGLSIAVDDAGNAYVTGQTYLDGFPTVNAIQPTSGGFGEAFISKLNASGTALVYSTYLGGADNELGDDIAVDSAGSVYITGHTESDNFPTANALQPTKSAFVDAFVTKLNPAGSALVYSTYLGGNNRDGDYESNIAVDSAGNAYIASNTASTDFPTVNAFQTEFRGLDDDVFIAKLNAQGSALLYSTYLGGNNINAGTGEYAYGLALDGSGNAYVTGYTFSTNFPLAGASFQSSNAGNFDAFVAIINDAGTPPTPGPSPTPIPTATPVRSPTPVPDFALTVSPSSQTVRRGSTTSYNITITSLNGFSGSVQLSVSGVPSRTNATFTKNPVTVNAGGTATSRLDVRPRAGAPTGTFTLTITATGGGKTHSQPVTLVIRP